MDAPFIRQVTLTGADDSIEPRDLLAMSRKFPFVEWGILFSFTRQGQPRYPSQKWLHALVEATERWADDGDYPKFSAHLCGSIVRALVEEGELRFRDLHPREWPIFQRVQINFHGQYHRACPKFVKTLRENGQKEWILQHDGENDQTIRHFTDQKDVSVSALFDRSGGAGIKPRSWPAPLLPYCGYAGGLSPDNLLEEIFRIQAMVKPVEGARIWIDAETHVRSNDDKIFNLAKVRQFLEIAAPFVEGPR